MRKTIAVIPARYNSSRFPGKPLADINEKPMIWWVYNQVKKSKEIDEVIVAIDDDRVANICNKFQINYVMTSSEHDTPTSRIYEVSRIKNADLYVFVGGDEPLIDLNALNKVVKCAKLNKDEVTHAMGKIESAPEVIDYTNIKVVVNDENYLIYATRSPIPFPKGGLEYEYMKFIGIGVFTKESLVLYNNTKKSFLEKIEECDLIRFIEKKVPVKMIEVDCRSISVDTPKDLELVISIMKKKY